MHLALIIDRERLTREHGMLQSLTSGFAEMDWQVTVVRPEDRNGAETEEPSGLAAESEIVTRMRVQPWMRRLRARQIADELAGAVPDLLYAMGERAWAVALDLARLIERPVTLDVWSADQVARLPSGRARARVAACLAATEPIAEALRRRVEPELVLAVPMGVEIPPQPRRVLEDRDSSMTLAIIGSGQDPVGHRAMLTGLSRLISGLPQIQACLELRGPYEHEIWRHARRLDLLGNISTIVDAAMHRPLLTGCDVLVVPERLGQMRSIILQAMALGMPVVAADDPWLDMLIDEQTALIVDHDDADRWTETLQRTLTDAALVAGLSEGARGLVQSRHRADEQLAHLTEAFDQIVSGGAHAFSAGV